MGVLEDWLQSGDPKKFEMITKHYYDLFAYHAAQRLTTFNFFIVSISFLSNAYATLITKGDIHSGLYLAAAILGWVAYSLCITFGRLDKRNEQIISINEKPLERIQQAIYSQMSTGATCDISVWQTLKETTKRSYRGRTFGALLPVIYLLAASLTAAGGSYGFYLSKCVGFPWAIVAWIISVIIAFAMINFKGPRHDESILDWLLRCRVIPADNGFDR